MRKPKNQPPQGSAVIPFPMWRRYDIAFLVREMLKQPRYVAEYWLAEQIAEERQIMERRGVAPERMRQNLRTLQIFVRRRLDYESQLADVGDFPVDAA